MYHIRLFFVAVMVATGLFSWGAEDDTIFFTFRHSDGSVTRIEIPFPENSEVTNVPTMTFKESSVEIVIPSDVPGEEPTIYSVEVYDVESSTFEDRETASVPNVVIENSVVFTPDGDRVGITAPEAIAASDVRVHDMSGRAIACETVTEGNKAVVSLADKGAGIYIISYKDKTVKVVKK